MLKTITLHLLAVYQRCIRIMLPCSCRYVPTCSEYTREAVVKYGFFKGAFKGALRLLNCHPLSKRSGYDPLV